MGFTVLAALILPARAEMLSDVSSPDERVLAAEPGDTILLVVGDQVSTAQVDRTRLWNRKVYLTRSGEEIRGRIAGQVLRLSLGATQVTGRISGRPILLDVARSAGALQVSGRFGAKRVALALQPATISGDVGPCRYSLEFRRSAYVGQLGCGGESSSVRLRVPSTLIARGDVELAAMLVTFLAR